MGNRKKPGFLHEIKRDLAALNKSIKDFLFNKDFPTIRAMDHWVGLKNKEEDDIWGSDPVHIKQEHYKILVGGVKITLDKITPKRRRESAGNATVKRGRQDSRGRGAGDRGRSGPPTAGWAGH
jgi:hypothetical protein